MREVLNMQEMQMNHIQALFHNITQHLIQDEKSSRYLNTLLDNKSFREYPFEMLYQLRGTEQSPIHHPEGDAWAHVMLVVNEAAKIRHLSTNAVVFMLAALLHDIGKPSTTRVRRGRITSYDHDKVGEKLAIELLEACIFDNEVKEADMSRQDFIQAVSSLVRYHMHVLFITKDLPYADRKGLLANVDIKDVALLGYADRMGRTKVDRDRVRKDVETFYDIYNS